VKPADVTDLTFFKGTGCDECSHSGYRGRLGIFELLPISEEIRDQIYNHASTDEIHAMALKQGMKTMRQDGWLKICAGITTFEEVAKHTPRETAEQIKNEMEEMLEQTIGKTPESGTGNAPGENISMSDLSGTEPWSEESGTKPADS